MKMKWMKKAVALIAVLCMTMVTGAPRAEAAAAATDKGTITVTKGDDGQVLTDRTVEVYALFDLEMTSTTAYKYTVKDAWLKFLCEQYNDYHTSDIVYNERWVTSPSGLSSDEAIAKENAQQDIAEWIGNLTGVLSEGTHVSENETLRKLASALEDEVINNKSNYATTLQTVAWTDGTSDGSRQAELPYGYYIIVEVSNSHAAVPGSPHVTTAPILASIDGTPKEIQLKTDMPTLEKKIIVDSGDKEYYNSALIGETVKYEITASIPDTTGYEKGYKYVITDTLSDGLEFVMDGSDLKEFSITIQGCTGAGHEDHTLQKGTDYTVKVDGKTLTIDLTDEIEEAESADNPTKIEKISETWGHKDGKLIITYSAKVTEQAVIGTAGNENTAQLQFSNDPKVEWNGTTYGETPESVTKTYVTKIQIKKVDSSNAILPGAEFTITDEATGEELKLKSDGVSSEYKVDADADSSEVNITAVIGSSGELTISGLKAGTYTIKETKAPDGYNPLSKPFQIKIECTPPADPAAASQECKWAYQVLENGPAGVTGETPSGEFVLTVVNRKGSILPITGGIGTTIFYVCGLVMITGAVVLLVVKKRSAQKTSGSN